MPRAEIGNAYITPPPPQVDGENIRKLALIPEPEVTLTAIDDVVYYDDEERARDSLRQHSFFQQCRAGRQVRLKVGAQVCLLMPFKKVKVVVTPP
jgi:hypothetical protein